MVAATAQADSIVTAKGLTKVFKDFWGRPKAHALNGIDLDVKRGQVFGLLGPNGSGKSTTVKLVLGLLYPTRGTIRVLNESPRNVTIKRRIGYLPEESYLYPYLTAAETLDFFGALFGLPADERRRRGEQLLEMVGLSNSSSRPVGEFSKGMARRIGLAQALVNDPDLVILDEPTSGLDPIGCREVKDVIRLLATRGKTVVLCSHLLSDVEDVCDEIVVLYGGKVRTQGSLQEVLTVADQTRIVAPRLDEELTAKVVDVIREHFPDQDVQVDHPTMNLEDFFLDVVRKAREASVATAGAQAGGAIAEYLRGDDESTEAEDTARTQALLEALKGSGASDEEQSEESLAEEAAEAAKAAAVDKARLASLAAAPTPESEVSAEPEPPPSAVTPEADKRIEDLLKSKNTN